VFDVVSNHGAPGYPWPSDYIEAGSYTSPLAGAVMFNLL
jgi:hypothetical protein